MWSTPPARFEIATLVWVKKSQIECVVKSNMFANSQAKMNCGTANITDLTNESECWGQNTFHCRLSDVYCDQSMKERFRRYGCVCLTDFAISNIPSPDLDTDNIPLCLTIWFRMPNKLDGFVTNIYIVRCPSERSRKNDKTEAKFYF